MITVEPPTPSPELQQHKSSTPSLVLPVRPHPTRTFSSPHSKSPRGPPTHEASQPPAYITRELGIAEQPLASPANRSRANPKSKSRSSSENGRLGADDFEFGHLLGEGSYSTVRFLSFFVHPYRPALLTCHRSQVIHGTHCATRQEYAIKVLDKGHVKRKNKLNTAIAKKNTLLRLGSGHPVIVYLHWAFQDD
ncbi:hypothetical protein EI94DRAFT_1816182 [Lactarius quietus]|nr:hypothetical protein EI94DRAFT_1816182 [Lactarius quietus]